MAVWTLIAVAVGDVLDRSSWCSAGCSAAPRSGADEARRLRLRRAAEAASACRPPPSGADPPRRPRAGPAGRPATLRHFRDRAADAAASPPTTVTVDSDIEPSRRPAPQSAPADPRSAARAPPHRRGDRRARPAHAPAARSHLLLPAVLTAALALRAGGFFPAAPAVLAVAMALLLVGRITLAERPFAGWSPALALCGGRARAARGLDARLRLVVRRAAAGHDRVRPRAGLPAGARLHGLLRRPHAATSTALLRWVALVVGALAAAALLTRLYPGTFPTGVGPRPVAARLPAHLLERARRVLRHRHDARAALHGRRALRARGARARRRRAARRRHGAVLHVLARRHRRRRHRRARLRACSPIRAACPSRCSPPALPVFLAVRAAYGAEGLATAEFARFPDEARERGALTVVALRAGGDGPARARPARRPAPRRASASRRRARRTVLRRRRRARWRRRWPWSPSPSTRPAASTTSGEAFFQRGPIATCADQRDRLGEFGANGRVEHWEVSLGRRSSASR